ncbi:MAG: hypothetical protein M1833_000931 [Piccolia ochrophora]|nr:MAG: hypothetical protein M1833_000931 [Piccolia ochrophora]
MDKFIQLKQSIVNVFSPAPKQPPVKKLAVKRPAPLAPRLDRRSMSPRSKTEQWLQRPIRDDPSPILHTPSKIAIGKPGHGKIQKRTPRTLRTSSATSGPRSGPASWQKLSDGDYVDSINEHSGYQFDGEDTTLIDGQTDLDGSTFTETQQSSKDKQNGDQNVVDVDVEEDSREDNAGLITSNEKHEGRRAKAEYTKAEGEKRLQEVLATSTEGWSRTERMLYRDMRMRGWVPLLPRHWEMDFLSLPSILFSAEDELVPIQALYGTDFHASHALKELFALPLNARGRLDAGRPAEKLIRREIERYMKWAEEDGDYGTANKNFPPNIVLLTPSRKTHHLDRKALAESFEDRLNHKFAALATRHRRLLHIRPSVEDAPPSSPASPQFVRTPPTLFGAIIHRASVVFTTYNAALPETDRVIRPIARLDLTDSSQDVWNGFGIALLVAAAREAALAVVDLEIYDGKKQGGSDVESDIDA